MTQGPIAFRYPRGEGVGIEIPDNPEPLEIGKGRIVREGSAVALLSLGGRLHECLAAADRLQAYGLSTTVADARFAKPLDREMILDLARRHEVLITVEEGAIGGFAAHVMQLLASEGVFDAGLKFRPMTLPDLFLDHDKPEAQYTLANLDAPAIVETVLDALKIEASQALGERG